MLLLDADLVKAIRVTNGDGAVLSASDYRYLPANLKPRYAIIVVNDAYWTYSSTPIQAIAVRGWWGFSLEPDAYTEQALTRLTAFLYKQKDAQTFDAVGFLEGGVMTIPQGIPRYVADFITARERKGLATGGN